MLNTRPFPDFETWVAKVRDPAIIADEGLRIIEAGDGLVSYQIAHLEDGVAIKRDFQLTDSSTGTPWLWFANRDAALQDLMDAAIAFYLKEKSGYRRDGCDLIIAKMREFRNLFGFDEPTPQQGIHMGPCKTTFKNKETS